MNTSNKTFIPKYQYNYKKWYIIDCKGKTLGRLATVVTNLLKGKNKAEYYPSIDLGDYVILINSDLIILNENSKQYLVYKPGRPGNSLKIKNTLDCLSTLVVKQAVKKMLSKIERKKLLRRLKVYENEKHLHKAQNPITFNF